MRSHLVSRRGAEGAEAAVSSGQAAGLFLIWCRRYLESDSFEDGVGAITTSLRPLFPLRLCAKHNFGVAQ
jgi:hypothetical protein